ncbi:MAG: hypothetical protein FWE32_07425 [Oscillospiraceae bacterium]|nr:hypothetical protein [Oscillospiraceae bacterium]
MMNQVTKRIDPCVLCLSIILSTLLLGCNSVGYDGIKTDSNIGSSVSSFEVAIDEEQRTDLDYTISQKEIKEQEGEKVVDSEIVAFIRSILSAQPLELSENELLHYTERYVHWAHFHGLIRDGWENPSEIDIDHLLGRYEIMEFNYWYVQEYARMNPNVNLWPTNELFELIVDEQVVESFITSFLEIDIERLRQSKIYDIEKRGYWFRVLDGLGSGIFHPYAHSVWKSDSYIVIEIHGRLDGMVGYALIETIDEDRFMFRAYVQLL